MTSQIIASFVASTLAPIGSLTRVNLAADWVYAAAGRCDDASVAYALESFKGWEAMGRMNPVTRQAFDFLVTECEKYLADAAAAQS